MKDKGRKAGYAILGVVGVVVFIFCLIGKHQSEDARIVEWAARHGYTLAGGVERPMFEPSPFLLNNEHDDILKVELVDAGQQRRTSWFRFRLFGMEQAWGN